MTTTKKDSEGVNTKKDQHEKRSGSGHHEKRTGSGHHEIRTGSGHHEKETGSGHHEIRTGSGHHEKETESGPWPLTFDLNTKTIPLTTYGIKINMFNTLNTIIAPGLKFRSHSEWAEHELTL